MRRTKRRGRPVVPDGPDHYRGRRAVLATHHDKLPAVGPALATTCGLVVDQVDVDTDALGTFAGDVPRRLAPLPTAVAKARLGMAAGGSPIGVATEATVGPHPGLPLVTVVRELVVVVDDELGTVVSGTAVGLDVVTVTAEVAPGDDLAALLLAADVPPHHLIVRPEGAAPVPVVRGVADPVALASAVRACADASPVGRARVETDLRAHRCPSRLDLIAEATTHLGERLRRTCPACGVPGWGPVDVVTGVPCRVCGTTCPGVRAEVEGCARCAHREERTVDPAALADPVACPRCNP